MNLLRFVVLSNLPWRIPELVPNDPASAAINSERLQSALDSSRLVLLPPAEFYFSKPIVIRNGFTTLMGDGAILRVALDVPGVDFLTIDNVGLVRITGLRFSQDRVLPLPPGKPRIFPQNVIASHAFKLVLEDIHFRESVAVRSLLRTSQGVMDATRVTINNECQAGEAGVHIVYSSDADWSNACSLDHLHVQALKGGPAVVIDGGSSHRVAGIIEGCKGGGVDLANIRRGFNVVLDGVHFEVNTSFDVRARAGEGVTGLALRSCFFNGGARQALVDLTGCTSASMESCHAVGLGAKIVLGACQANPRDCTGLEMS